MDATDMKLANNETLRNLVEERILNWNIDLLQNRDYQTTISRIKELIFQLHSDLFKEHDENSHEALQKIVFATIHDLFLPSLRAKFDEEDLEFFEKCKALCKLNVSAEHFGGDENYSIPLTAAIVELSILDKYKTPIEKMNCLCGTYDLLYAELKTAIVSLISKKSDDDQHQEFPIVNNNDILPVLMVVIIKSKLVHAFSNLFYIRSFCYKLEGNTDEKLILEAFEQAVQEIDKIDVNKLEPKDEKIKKSIDLAEFIRLTSEDHEDQSINKTLVDVENERIISLITRSTSESNLY